MLTLSERKRNIGLSLSLNPLPYFAKNLETMKLFKTNPWAALSFAALTLFAVSCGDDDNKPMNGGGGNTGDSTVVMVSNNITSNTTWSKDKTYILANRISVVSGVELTIDAGTVIKGQAGSGANATALVIARGAKLFANGTAAEPIIFTSVADEIESGMIVGPNLDPNQTGLWGGVIVLGNARASLSGDVQEAAIEGIPATDVNGKYGGTNDADNSGVIRYISIRHGGANIGEGNEINGLTLGGVGTGTTVEYVEIVANSDDGVEFFGGTVNVSNVVVWNNGDDAIDTDQAWAGTLDNFVIVNPGDEAFELDGPEGSYQGAGHTIQNGTVFAGDASGLIDYDDNTDVSMNNIYFTNLTIGQDVEGYSGYALNTNGFASSNFEATLPTVDADGNPASYMLNDFFKGGSDLITTEVDNGQNSIGANLTQLKSWSMTGQSNQF